MIATTGMSYDMERSETPQ